MLTDHKLPWPPGAKMLDQCFKQSHELCSSEENSTGCFIGCLLLANTLHPRPGECPPPSKTYAPPPPSLASGALISADVDCSRGCQLDSDCPGAPQTLKCCPTSCGGSTCIQPIYNESIPPLTEPLQLVESKSLPLSIDLNWSSPYGSLVDSMGPIVFVLQTRICPCKLFDRSQVTTWHTLTMTHLFGAKLDAFERGKMYQFRLAAVNSFGTRGFSPASSPYPRQPKSPEPPGQPKNITDALWRFYQADSVSVLLKWAAPEHSDLPVVEYRVKWVVDHGYIQSDGKPMEGLTEFIKTVPQDVNEYLLKGLRTSTTYKIAVQAISYWHGFGSLESLPATTFLSTQSVRHTVQQQPSGKQAFRGQQTLPFNSNDRSAAIHKTPPTNRCGCDQKEPSTGMLKIKSTFFDNGDLWAMAQVDLAQSEKGMYLLAWAPQVCINLMEEEVLPTEQKLKIPARTHTVVLEQLRLNCRYTLFLHQLLSSDQSNRGDLNQETKSTSVSAAKEDLERSKPLARLCFCTPSCWSVEVRRGSLPANCPSKDPEPPLSPTGVRVEKTGETDYRVLWRPSDPEGSLHFNPQPSHSPPLTSSVPRRTRTTPRDVSSALSPVGEKDHQLTKYRVVWAPRLDEPVDHRMYNEAVGFVPIMDLQQSDVRIVGAKHTSLDLKELKRDTVYIVRIQTLVSLPSGVKLESSPTSIYFATSPVNDDQSQSREHGTSNRHTSSAAVVVVSKILCLAVLIAKVYLFS